jgi:hypothetical protein
MIKTSIALIVGAFVCSAGPVTYIVNETVGTHGSVTGSIETDGTLGAPLELANILDWNLVLNNGTSTFDLMGPLSGPNSTLSILDGSTGSDLTATATQLLFNFSDTGDGFALFQDNTPVPPPYWCLETSSACTGQQAGQDLAITSADISNLLTNNTFSALSGNVVIGTVSAPVGEVGSPDPVVGAPTPASTPEPSTLSFLGLGFAALGFWKHRAARRA